MKKILIAFLGLFILGAVMQEVANSDKTEEQKAAESADRVKHKTIGLAEATCQLAAEKQAHDPKSIEWLRDERHFRFDNKPETKATSTQPMRARNAMGALVRTGIMCKLLLAADGWKVVKMSAMK